MSRGLGRIEQKIQQGILECQIGRYSQGEKSPVTMSSRDVAIATFPQEKICLGSWKEPSRPQRIAVNRAMHSFVRKFPQFALMGGQGRKPIILYDTTDPESIAWATARTQNKGFVALCDSRVKALLNRA
jgi:hypothetical protein